MNTPLRRVTIGVGVMIMVLLLNATYVQVFESGSLRADPRNQRVLKDEYSRQRGQIIAGSQVLALSRKTDDTYKYLRVYPQNNAEAYADITGYYSMQYSRSGLEQADDSFLNGSDDRLFGRRFLDLLRGRDPSGGNVVTTIDPKLQQVAYQQMAQGCGGHGCKGAVVALQPKTGKILAMVSTPSYNPNLLASHNPATRTKAWNRLVKDPNHPMINRAISQTFPPGSTFKIVTTAAALEQGITPKLRLTADSSIKLPDTNITLTNYAREACPGSVGGTVSLLQAFQYSCNTAFVQLGTQKIRDGAANLTRVAGAFGINSQPAPIPLDVAESVTGNISDPAILGQSVIGQRNVALTPLQNAMIAATIANGGTMMQPYLVDSLQGPDLRTVSRTSPKVLRQAVPASVAAEITKLMIASEQHTTGYGQVPFEIASKTGTAEHSDSNNNPLPPHAWYVAFAPSSNAKIAVAVIVEDGGNDGQAATGGSVAAPVGRAVMQAAMQEGS